MLDRTVTALSCPAALLTPTTKSDFAAKTAIHLPTITPKTETAAKSAIYPTSTPTQSHISGNIGNTVSGALGKIEIAAKTARVLNSPTSKKGDRGNIGNTGNIGKIGNPPRHPSRPKPHARQYRQRSPRIDQTLSPLGEGWGRGQTEIAAKSATSNPYVRF